MPKAASHHFSGSFMAARIVTQSGEKIPLWQSPKMESESSDSSSAGMPKTLPYLQEITVELGLGAVPILKAVLTPPYAAAMRILDSRLVEWVSNTLEVQFGYTGGSSQAVLSPVYTGVIIKPEIEFGEYVTITLNGQGVAGFSTARANSNIKSKANSKIRRIDLIQQILDGADPKNKRKLKADPSRVKAGSAARKLLDEKITYTQSGEDLFALWKLVTDCQCWYYITGGSLIILPRAETMKEVASKKFMYMDFRSGQIGPDVGVYPILTLTSPTSHQYLPGSMRGFVTQDVDPKTRKPETRVIDDKKAHTPRVGGGGGDIKPSPTLPGADPKSGAGATRMTVPIESKEGEEAIQAEYQRQQGMCGVQLEINSLGVPDLVPGETVYVGGISKKRIDGLYSTMKLTHSYGTGGASTSFTCVSNAHKLLANVTAALGPQNTKDPVAPSSGKTAEAKSGA